MWQSGFWADGLWSAGFWGDPQRFIAEVELDFSKKPSPYREALELADSWIPKKTRKILKRLAKEIVDNPSARGQAAPSSIDSTSMLVQVLTAHEIAYKRAYDDFLQAQIEAYRNEQIRQLFEVAGVYQQIELEDERALMLLFMEL